VKVCWSRFFSGPTSLIQFKVWQSGTIDLSMLCELLKSALRHSVCDIILEYYLLTAPICRVPPHYCKGMLSPMRHSAPTSPNNTVALGNQLISVTICTCDSLEWFLCFI